MKIKPCPDCGAKGVLKPDGALWIVKCHNKTCDRNAYSEPSEREAVRKWNNRLARRGTLQSRKATEARKKYEMLPAGHMDKPEALRIWRYWQARSSQETTR